MCGSQGGVTCCSGSQACQRSRPGSRPFAPPYALARQTASIASSWSKHGPAACKPAAAMRRSRACSCEGESEVARRTHSVTSELVRLSQ